MTVDAAHAQGKWVGVCGELAADALAIPMLVGLGVDELSVSARSIALVKARVRELGFAACQRLAQQALMLPGAHEVRAFVGSTADGARTDRHPQSRAGSHRAAARAAQARVNRSDNLQVHAAGKGLNLAGSGRSWPSADRDRLSRRSQCAAFRAAVRRAGFADEFVRVAGETRSNIKLAGRMGGLPISMAGAGGRRRPARRAASPPRARCRP